MRYELRQLDHYVAIGAARPYLTGVRFNNPANALGTQNQMVAQLGLPGSLTEKGRQLASIMINMSGGPRPFAMEGLVPPRNGVPAYQFILSGATLAGSTTPGNLTRGNATANFLIDPGLGVTNAALNAGVRRFAPQTALYQAYEETRPLTGKIERPLITLYNTADYIVVQQLAGSAASC